MDNQNINTQTPLQENDKAQMPEEQESAAVRPHHRFAPMEASDSSTLGIRNVLNIIFMLLAIAGACIYMFSRFHNVGVIIMIIAVVIKVVEVSLRMFHK